MTKPKTIQSYLRKAILSYAGVGLLVLVFVSAGLSYLLSRAQMANDLEKSASATVEAFKDRIVDGDIRSVEPQIVHMLQLHEDESAQVLDSHFSRIYDTFQPISPVKKCSVIGETCFDGLFGQARILYPIALDSKSNTPFGYLYISKHIHFNWTEWLTVFAVFSVGYIGLMICFFRISNVAIGRLGHEIDLWSERLQSNAKNSAPLDEPPFFELLSLKSAIEGLHGQIEKYESTATDKAKLLLLRGIAHDLLNPVSQLQLNIATLESSLGDAKRADLIEDINDALKKVTAIASQVKALKEPEPLNENVSLSRAAKEDIEALRGLDLIKQKNIELNLRTDLSNVPVPFSRTELSRILTNLIQNAADASSNGGMISVEIYQRDGVPVLSIEDQGCGIPQAARGRVFDPDFTLKPNTGTGLGLAIVKYLCDQRSAKIELESELNRGTKISVVMPTGQSAIGGARA